MLKLFSMLNLSLSIHQINNFTNQCTHNFFSPTNTIPCIKCFANDVTVFSRKPEVHPIILSSKKTSKCNISFKVDLSKLTNTKEEEIVAVKIVVVVLVIAIVAKTAAVVVAVIIIIVVVVEAATIAAVIITAIMVVVMSQQYQKEQQQEQQQ